VQSLDVARWANVGGLITVPSAGKMDVGWVPGETPPAETFNWIENLAYQWQQYLSDGAFSGASTFDNTLGVTGLLTASGGITVPTGQAVTLAGTTTLAIGGNVTTDVTLTANKNVTVSGTGGYKHPTRTIILGPGAFQLDFSSGSPTGNSTPGAFTGTPLAGSTPWVFANIDLPSGKQINTIRAYIHDNTTGVNIMSVALVTNDATGAIATVGTSSGSAGNSTDQTLTLPSLTTTIATGKSYSIRINTSAASQVKVYKVEIDYIE
jgi:hypothetical protein